MKKAVIVLLAPMLAQATLTPNLPGRGAEKISLDRGEICYIPNRLEGSKFTKKDLEKEQQLCAMNISTTNAVCGKVESTNPALEFFEVPDGWTAAQVEAKNCFLQDQKAKEEKNVFSKKAKYKLSTSCSYTPSLLAYYQISRFFGNINQVPPVVLRTVDAEIHKSIGTKTANLIKDKQSLISQTWASLLSILTKGSAHAKSTNVFTDDYRYSFGALQNNPSKEEKYSELYNGGSDQPTRAANFKSKNLTYKRLASTAALNSMGMNQWSQANVQEVLRMQNVADMILLDTMLSQADRFGNLHYTVEPYAIITKNGKTKVDKLDKGETYPQGTVLVKKLMMKDNDCGVTKENVLKKAGLLEGLRHFNPETFEKLLKLQKLLTTSEGQLFFKEETAMTQADVDGLKNNIAHSVDVLVNSCKAGQLLLDLDLDSQFGNAAIPDCRAIIQANQ